MMLIWAIVGLLVAVVRCGWEEVVTFTIDPKPTIEDQLQDYILELLDDQGDPVDGTDIDIYLHFGNEVVQCDYDTYEYTCASLAPPIDWTGYIYITNGENDDAQMRELFSEPQYYGTVVYNDSNEITFKVVVTIPSTWANNPLNGVFLCDIEGEEDEVACDGQNGDFCNFDLTGMKCAWNGEFRMIFTQPTEIAGYHIYAHMGEHFADEHRPFITDGGVDETEWTGTIYWPLTSNAATSEFTPETNIETAIIRWYEDGCETSVSDSLAGGKYCVHVVETVEGVDHITPYQLVVIENWALGSGSELEITQNGEDVLITDSTQLKLVSIANPPGELFPQISVDNVINLLTQNNKLTFEVELSLPAPGDNGPLSTHVIDIEVEFLQFTDELQFFNQTSDITYKFGIASNPTSSVGVTIETQIEDSNPITFSDSAKEQTIKVTEDPWDGTLKTTYTIGGVEFTHNFETSAVLVTLDSDEFEINDEVDITVSFKYFNGTTEYEPSHSIDGAFSTDGNNKNTLLSPSCTSGSCVFNDVEIEGFYDTLTVSEGLMAVEFSITVEVSPSYFKIDKELQPGEDNVVVVTMYDISDEIIDSSLFDKLSINVGGEDEGCTYENKEFNCKAEPSDKWDGQIVVKYEINDSSETGELQNFEKPTTKTTLVVDNGVEKAEFEIDLGDGVEWTASQHTLKQTCGAVTSTDSLYTATQPEQSISFVIDSDCVTKLILSIDHPVQYGGTSYPMYFYIEDFREKFINIKGTNTDPIYLPPMLLSNFAPELDPSVTSTITWSDGATGALTNGNDVTISAEWEDSFTGFSYKIEHDVKVRAWKVDGIENVGITQEAGKPINQATVTIGEELYDVLKLTEGDYFSQIIITKDIHKLGTGGELTLKFTFEVGGPATSGSVQSDVVAAIFSDVPQAVVIDEELDYKITGPEITGVKFDPIKSGTDSHDSDVYTMTIDTKNWDGILEITYEKNSVNFVHTFHTSVYSAELEPVDADEGDEDFTLTFEYLSTTASAMGYPPGPLQFALSGEGPVPTEFLLEFTSTSSPGEYIAEDITVSTSDLFLTIDTPRLSWGIKVTQPMTITGFIIDPIPELGVSVPAYTVTLVDIDGDKQDYDSTEHVILVLGGVPSQPCIETLENTWTCIASPDDKWDGSIVVRVGVKDFTNFDSPVITGKVKTNMGDSEKYLNIELVGSDEWENDEVYIVTFYCVEDDAVEEGAEGDGDFTLVITLPDGCDFTGVAKVKYPEEIYAEEYYIYVHFDPEKYIPMTIEGAGEVPIYWPYGLRDNFAVMIDEILIAHGKMDWSPNWASISKGQATLTYIDDINGVSHILSHTVVFEDWEVKGLTAVTLEQKFDSPDVALVGKVGDLHVTIDNEVTFAGIVITNINLVYQAPSLKYTFDYELPDGTEATHTITISSNVYSFSPKDAYVIPGGTVSLYDVDVTPAVPYLNTLEIRGHPDDPLTYQIDMTGIRFNVPTDDKWDGVFTIKYSVASVPVTQTVPSKIIGATLSPKTFYVDDEKEITLEMWYFANVKESLEDLSPIAYEFKPSSEPPTVGELEFTEDNIFTDVITLTTDTYNAIQLSSLGLTFVIDVFAFKVDGFELVTGEEPAPGMVADDEFQLQLLFGVDVVEVEATLTVTIEQETDVEAKCEFDDETHIYTCTLGGDIDDDWNGQFTVDVSDGPSFLSFVDLSPLLESITDAEYKKKVKVSYFHSNTWPEAETKARVVHGNASPEELTVGWTNEEISIEFPYEKDDKQWSGTVDIINPKNGAILYLRMTDELEFISIDDADKDINLPLSQNLAIKLKVSGLKEDEPVQIYPVNEYGNNAGMDTEGKIHVMASVYRSTEGDGHYPYAAKAYTYAYAGEMFFNVTDVIFNVAANGTHSLLEIEYEACIMIEEKCNEPYETVLYELGLPEKMEDFDGSINPIFYYDVESKATLSEPADTNYVSPFKLIRTDSAHLLTIAKDSEYTLGVTEWGDSEIDVTDSDYELPEFVSTIKVGTDKVEVVSNELTIDEVDEHVSATVTIPAGHHEKWDGTITMTHVEDHAKYIYHISTGMVLIKAVPSTFVYDTSITSRVTSVLLSDRTKLGVDSLAVAVVLGDAEPTAEQWVLSNFNDTVKYVNCTFTATQKGEHKMHVMVGDEVVHPPIAVVGTPSNVEFLDTELVRGEPGSIKFNVFDDDDQPITEDLSPVSVTLDGKTFSCEYVNHADYAYECAIDEVPKDWDGTVKLSMLAQVNTEGTYSGKIKGGLSGPAKAGIAIGVIAAVLIIAAIVYFLVIRPKMKRAKSAPRQPSSNNHPSASDKERSATVSSSSGSSGSNSSSKSSTSSSSSSD